MKTFAHYPNQKKIIVFSNNGKKELETFNYSADEELYLIVRSLIKKGITQKNYFDYIYA